MKVVRNTPTQLIMESRPWISGILLFSALGLLVWQAIRLAISDRLHFHFGDLVFWMAMTGFFAVVFVRRNQLILDCTKNILTLRKRTVFGSTEVTHKLEYVESVIVQSRTNTKPRKDRAVFVLNGGMSKGLHPITDKHSATNTPINIAKHINDWLNAARQNGHFPTPVDSKRPNP